MAQLTDESVHDGHKSGTKGQRESEAKLIHILILSPKMTTEGHSDPLLYNTYSTAVTMCI